MGLHANAASGNAIIKWLQVEEIVDLLQDS